MFIHSLFHRSNRMYVEHDILPVDLFFPFLCASVKMRKRLLPSSCLPSCLSVCPSTYLSPWNNQAPNGQIYRVTQKTGTFEKPKRNCRNKNNIDRNWTITTCLLRDSNPNYQSLKITSSRSLFRSAANCTWLPLRISIVPVFCVTLYINFPFFEFKKIYRECSRFIEICQ
jgi:Fe-S oxidoreductase